MVRAFETDGLLMMPLALNLLPEALLFVYYLLDQPIQQRLCLLSDVHSHRVVYVHLRDFGPNQVVALLLVALNSWQSL